MAELQVIQIGCGAMGKGWIEAAVKTPGLQVVGLVDLSKATAAAAAEKFSLPAGVVCDSLEEALAAHPAAVVFDVTIPASHESVVICALQHGRHVLGEKPMSESLASAKRMVDAAGAAGKFYAVMQNYRYQPAIRSLKAFLASGAIGAVQEIHTDFFLGAHFGGFRDEMAFPLLLDMSIHTFDAARFLSGADPVDVYCHSFNPGRSWYRGDASAVAIFRMTREIVFSYRGSWCAEGQNTGWDSSWRIVGQRGSVLWDGGDTFKAEAVDLDAPAGFIRKQKQLSRGADMVTMPVTGHAAVIREFVDCVTTGRTPETACSDNIKSLAMVFAAVASAKAGAKVPVEF
jgi:predicted dehydrogenase